MSKRGKRQCTFNSPPTVIDHFLSQTKSNPDVPAVRCGDNFITYSDLDKKSGHLSTVLRNRNIGKESIVPILLEPGIDFMIAIVGIMKSGAAYVPIDPEFPAERIHYILKDTSSTVMVTDRSLPVNVLPQNFTLLYLTEDGCQTLASEFSQESSLPVASDLAYIIYTSGSTGHPKGVMVEHAQLTAYLEDANERLGLSDCRQLGVLGTFAADAGLTAIFGSIIYGNCLNIVNVKKTGFGELLALFQKYPLHCYKITPSLIEFFLQQPGSQQILPTQCLILGGEACPAHLAIKLRQLLPETCAMHNHYGPTETTIGVITFKFPDRLTPTFKGVPLGTPLAHVGIHILNDNYQAVVNGQEGELFISGPLVAKGYLNRPELSAERFINLVINNRSERIYKTGDVVRMLSNGNIEFLGRTDDQIKINGNRIELKEIETIILRRNDIKRCLVIAQQDSSEKKYLVAYLLKDSNLKRDVLIKYLRNYLPGYMIPTDFVFLKTWPLTVNNKVDRNSFPKPKFKALKAIGSPTSQVEAELTQLVRKIIATGSPGRRDDFYSLGADSLKLMKLGYEISVHFRTAVSLYDIMTYSSIASLGKFIEKRLSVLPETENKQLASCHPEDVTITQKNLFLRNKLKPSESFPNSSLTYKLSGTIDLNRLEAAVNKLINLHESLKTGFTMENGHVRVCRLHFQKLKIHHLQSDSDDLDKVLNSLTQPYDYKAAPLLRVYLIDVKARLKCLHIDLPHINSDGESLKVIINELAAIYNGKLQDKQQVQFSDFKRSAHRYPCSQQYLRDEAFWKSKLSTGFPKVVLPQKDCCTIKAGEMSGNYIVSSLPGELVLRLDTFIRNKKLTRYQLLLMTYSLLLHQITGLNRLALMTPVSNRDEERFSGVIGLLANVVLITSDITTYPCLNEYIGTCKAEILQALSHQKYPFEKMILWLTDDDGKKYGFPQFFAGYHRLQPKIRLGEAQLRLYIPRKDKENLPLSIAFFDTGNSIKIRLSSASLVYTEAELQNLMNSYCDFLDQITNDTGQMPLGIYNKHQERSIVLFN